MRLTLIALIAGSLALAGCTVHTHRSDADLLHDSTLIDTGVDVPRPPVYTGCDFRKRVVLGQGEQRRYGTETEWRYHSKEWEVRCAPGTYPNPYSFKGR